MSGNLRWMGRLDMYRKVPTDLLEGTKRGSVLSLMASFVMLSLFLLETGAFFRKTYVPFELGIGHTDLDLPIRLDLNFD
jgi:hypothetical protein